MPTPNELIIHSLTVSQRMLHRFLDDLTPAEYLHRPVPGANCAAWLVGHLTLTERRGLDGIGVSDLPPLPDGFEKRFSREEGVPQAAEFGDVTGLLALFETHRGLLIEKVRQLPDAELSNPLAKAHPMFTTVGERLNFLGHHVTMHTGQLSTIRRSLGRPPLM